MDYKGYLDECNEGFFKLEDTIDELNENIYTAKLFKKRGFYKCYIDHNGSNYWAIRGYYAICHPDPFINEDETTIEGFDSKIELIDYLNNLYEEINNEIR